MSACPVVDTRQFQMPSKPFDRDDLMDALKHPAAITGVLSCFVMVAVRVLTQLMLC